MKIGVIYYTLFVIFSVTIIKIFWKPVTFSTPPVSRGYTNVSNPEFLYHKLFCPVTGYKCETDACDCQTLCGETFVKYTVSIDSRDQFYLSTIQLEPGTYCIPRKSNECNTFTTYGIYNLQGWSCVLKYPHLYAGEHGNSIVACKSKYAKNNVDNYLWDKLTNSITERMDGDPFELLDDGSFRYECHCHSFDFMNNPMKALKMFPFTCVSDYCVRNIYQAAAAGFNENTQQCECEPGTNKDLNDFTTACVPPAVVVMDRDIVTGFKSCTSKNSILHSQSFPCPDFFKAEQAVNLVRFQITVKTDSLHSFLNT